MFIIMSKQLEHNNRINSDVCFAAASYASRYAAGFLSFKRCKKRGTFVQSVLEIIKSSCLTRIVDEG